MIRLEDILKMPWRRFSRRLEDVLKTSSKRLEDVLKMSWRAFCKTSWRRLQNVLKTSWRRIAKMNMFVLSKTKGILKTSSRRLHQDECLLGRQSICNKGILQFLWGCLLCLQRRFVTRQTRRLRKRKWEIKGFDGGVS